ncbi:MAG: hypothetical protein ACLU30_17965 [Odoribacter splanchnicus]
METQTLAIGKNEFLVKMQPKVDELEGWRSLLSEAEKESVIGAITTSSKSNPISN